MEIPIDSLRKLPEDAVYEKKEGKATVKAGVKDGTLLVSASCDSLQALVYVIRWSSTKAKKDRMYLHFGCKSNAI